MESKQPVDYMADFFPPELLADSSLWQKLYIPAPWRDREMLGQAVLNALKYSDRPYSKRITSVFDRPKPKSQGKLHRAAMDGDVNAFPKSNRSGKSYDIVDSRGKTPLMFAASNGHIDVIERLLSFGADVNLGDHDGQSPLHHAAASEQPDTVAELIRAGAKVNQLDFLSRTPLHVAAKTGHVHCATELLNSGAIPNAHDQEHSSTPLHLAARANHADVARILIQGGAQIDPKNEGGRTPLHVAAAYGHQEVMTPLLDAGATVNYLDDIEESPLSSTVFFQHLECMTLLIEHGANVNLAGYLGYTPLHVAGYLNRENTVSILAEASGDLEAKDNEGLTPLDLAFVQSQMGGMYRNAEVIERLLEAGSSVDRMRIPVQDRHAHWPQFTPPHMVDSYGFLIPSTIPDLLPDLALEFRAAKVDDFGLQAPTLNPRRSLLCDVISKRMDSLLVRLLNLGIGESYNSKWYALEEAVQQSNFEAIRILIEHGADIDYPGNTLSDDNWHLRYDGLNFRSNMVDLAIKTGQADLARFLLKLGATPPATYDEITRFNSTRRPGDGVAHPIAGCRSNADKDAVVKVFADFGFELVPPEFLKYLKRAHRTMDENRPTS